MTDRPVVALWTDEQLGGVPDRRTVHASTPKVFFPKMLVRNVTHPTITAYLPAEGTATGLGVVVCPGGAMHFHSIETEGNWVAEWLNEKGVAAFVLEYRLAPTADDSDQFEDDMIDLFSGGDKLADLKGPYEGAAAADGMRAIEVVRERAGEWGVDPAKVGIIGFSAGGFVTLQTALLGSGPSRPDFAGGIYAALWDPFTVPEQPMPLFVAVSRDDQIGAVMTGTAHRLQEAWAAVGAPVELHMYQSGGHGFGMNKTGTTCDAWIDQFHEWLLFNVQAGLVGGAS